jgi:hypothetical protein
MKKDITKQIERDGIIYNPNKTYWVAGPRSAWDDVRIGLYESKDAVDADYPIGYSVAAKATKAEVKSFFKL